MKPRIAFDCDGVILSWRGGFGRHVQERLGLTLTDDDFQHGDCSDYPTFQAAGLSGADIDGVLDSYFYDGPAVLEDNAIAQCWAWLQQWAEPVIVTNRPKGCATQAKLAELGIEADVIHNVGAKAGWAMLIDDWAEHCHSNDASGGQSILYRQPWSGAYAGMEATSWRDLMARLEKLLADEKAKSMPAGPSACRRAPPAGTQDHQAFMRKRYAMMAGQLSAIDREDAA